VTRASGQLSSRTRKLAIDGGEPLRSSFLPFGQPTLDESEIARVADVLRSGWLGMGQRTLDFEQAFAHYVGARHAVAVSSCTAGLRMALETAGVRPGDEVITTPMTFAATVNVILAVGGRPVLADIDPDTFNLRPEAVAAAIGPRTRVLMPVHFGGLPCDLAELWALAGRHDLRIVEDAAHAVGAEYAGRRIGGHGHLAAFSFYPNKNMTTIEGGMVTTDDAAAADDLRLQRMHGLSNDAWRRYTCQELIVSQVVRSGFKYNMTDVQAELGLSQLGRLDGFLAVRRAQAERYDRELAGLPLQPQRRPPAASGHLHALHLYVVLVELERLRVDRDTVVRALRAENIGVGVHYQAIHQHPYFARELAYRPGDLPGAERAAARTLTLPLGPSMTDADQDLVLAALRDVLGHYAA